MLHESPKWNKNFTPGLKRFNNNLASIPFHPFLVSHPLSLSLSFSLSLSLCLCVCHTDTQIHTYTHIHTAPCLLATTVNPNKAVQNHYLLLPFSPPPLQTSLKTKRKKNSLIPHNAWPWKMTDWDIVHCVCWEWWYGYSEFIILTCS